MTATRQAVFDHSRKERVGNSVAGDLAMPSDERENEHVLKRRRIAQRIAQRLALVPGVTSIAVFGSVAKGTARDDSDIDLAATYHDTFDQIPGAADALAKLQATGCSVRLLTNVDSRSGEMIREDLNAAGFDLAPGQVYSAIDACVAYLRANEIRSVFSLVSDRVRPLFEPWLVADGPPDAVVIGDTRECCSYESLNLAFRHLVSGARLLATQKGRFFLTADGAQLDTGGFVALLEYSASTQAVIAGKPTRHFFEGALAEHATAADRVIVVGDDRATDIAGAHAMDWESVLVHTGKGSIQTRSADDSAPTWEIETIADLPQLIGGLAATH